MRGRLPTFAAVVRYGLIAGFSSADGLLPFIHRALSRRKHEERRNILAQQWVHGPFESLIDDLWQLTV
jgi:hypothetical protein